MLNVFACQIKIRPMKLGSYIKYFPRSIFRFREITVTSWQRVDSAETMLENRGKNFLQSSIPTLDEETVWERVQYCCKIYTVYRVYKVLMFNTYFIHISRNHSLRASIQIILSLSKQCRYQSNFA